MADKIEELISLKTMSKEEKVYLLNKLGYESDGVFISENGKRVKDKYTKEAVKLDNMLILPGSTLILDNNPLSVASYIEEYGDVF